MTGRDDVLSLAEQDTRLHKESWREYSGPCPNPNCDRRRDGFRVKWTGERWIWMCRGCWDCQEYLPEKSKKRGWGDAIDYLRHFKGMSFRQAKALVGGAEVGDERQQTDYSPVVHDEPRLTAPEQAGSIVHDAIHRLWQRTPAGAAALAYCRSKRGLDDQTIRDAHLGLWVSASGIPYLMIPACNAGRYFAIFRRDIRPDGEGWKLWPGSSTQSELYLADCLKTPRPTVLCEDALSALSVIQAMRRDDTSGRSHIAVNVVATGGTGGARQSLKCIAQLARQPLVLVALDADEAGDTAAQWWLDRLPNAVRVRPLLKDMNDMLMAGWDIRAWLEAHLPSDEKQDNDTLRCIICGIDVEKLADFSYNGDGQPVCPEHTPDEYKSEHNDAIFQGHMPLNELPEPEGELQFINELNELPDEQADFQYINITNELPEQAETLNEVDNLPSFMAQVGQRMAEAVQQVYPRGGVCTAEVLPPDMTAQEYIKQRMAEMDREAAERKKQEQEEFKAVMRQARQQRSKVGCPSWLNPDDQAWHDHIDYLCLGPPEFRATMQALGLRPQMTRAEALAEMYERRAAWLAQDAAEKEAARRSRKEAGRWQAVGLVRVA